MPRGQLTKDIIKCEVLKMKRDLDHERYSEGIKFLAHQYLNKVLDKIDEYRADGFSPIPYNSQVFGRHYPQMGVTKWGLDK